MHIYDQSTTRQVIWSARINWSRELTFSERQARFISQNVPNARGVYCIYARNQLFKRIDPTDERVKRSPIVYIGCGWLDKRLCSHLQHKRNDILTEYLDRYELAYRFDRIADTDIRYDWPRIVEAALLRIYVDTFGALPLANKRDEMLPPLKIDRFFLDESENFSILRRS